MSAISLSWPTEPLALRTVKVGRVFTLPRALRAAAPEQRADYGEWFADWFSRLLQPDRLL